MGDGRVKKFYLYSKREAEVLIIFFPSFFALPLLFCPVCIFSFLFFPLHSSPICYQPLTELYSSVLSPHMLFDTHRIPLILGLCLFYVSFPPIGFLLSSLPSLSWSQPYRPYSSFLGSDWKLVPGRTPLEVFLGLIFHRCLIRALRPLRNLPLYLQGFFSVSFLTILLDT